MLQIKNVVKEYVTGDTTVKALKGVSIDFRENEFVSILGPSGCGKTTFLNIIGGLDKYTSGDMIINGISTKKYKARDWDSYRNHSIGFVFQSYNLIPHQNVLSNVELALTLSGVSKRERKKRAKEALEKVGLGDQIYKKPNQMSGGQMQRVAIARALVNNPDILLADEPTGALDTETSVQIMELLKEVASDRLVIMVTHNPELAEQYSTRIVRLLDGKIISDTMPVGEDAFVIDKDGKKSLMYPDKAGKTKEKEQKKEQDVIEYKKPPRTSMGIMTALSLSLKNLLTKKARTFLTAFAGSIGIIGIALILSLSNGVQEYIDQVQEDTLSNYPLSIEKTTIDMTSFMTSMADSASEKQNHDLDKIYTNQIMTGFMELMMNQVAENNLSGFKKYIDENRAEFDPYISDLQYSYTTKLNIYRGDLENGVYQVNPGQVFASMGMGAQGGKSGSTGLASSSMMTQSFEVWQRLIDNDELLNSQYEVLAGRMPKEFNEVVLCVSGNNEITDYTLYSLGLLDSSILKENMMKMIRGEETEFPDAGSYTYDELLGISFKLLVNSDYFEKKDGVWVDRSKDEVYLLNKLKDSVDVKIVGILRPTSSAAKNQPGGTIGYKSALMDYLIEKVAESDIVKEQKANPDVDVFSGIKFTVDEPEADAAEEKEMTLEEFMAYVGTLPEEQQSQILPAVQQMKEYGMDDRKIVDTILESMKTEEKTTDATYEGNMKLIGVSDIDNPSLINIFPKDFASKDKICEIIENYNNSHNKEDEITYTDYVGLIMSSVTTIINAISYILIAFVAISLIVSSIMIGIITYISVLERTKEIGVLRAIGASKTDVSRVFNAETLIVGFTAGALGIIVSLLLLIPINAIVYKLTDIQSIAKMPPMAGVILVLISMALTLIAGIIPSRVAAKKDPVVALRSE